MVVNEKKLTFKDFREGTGVHLLFMENYKADPEAEFQITYVPIDSDKQTSEKKNYHCIDVQQRTSNPKQKVYRGFVVSKPNQSVFYSASKHQGFLMVSKSKKKNVEYLRPFLCAPIIKLKDEGQNAISKDEDRKETAKIEEEFQKILKQTRKVPIERVYLNKLLDPTLNNTKSKREKKDADDDSVYVDNDKKIGKQEDSKFKLEKQKQRQNYEEGNIDEEEIFQEDDDDFDD